MSDYIKQNGVEGCRFDSSESWVILSEIEQRIKTKIEAIGTPLKDWDINIYRGILTGCNEAFIIDKVKKENILANCQTDEERQKTAEIIRPILRGRDIKRYGYEFADLYLLFIPWHFPLHLAKPEIKGASLEAEKAFENQYPAIYNHLLQYKKELSNRNKAETGIRYEWYALQRWGANYWEDFSKQKIAWASVGETLYSLIPESTYLLDTNYFFSIEKKQIYLLAILNSKLITYWINSEDTPIGKGGAYRHYKYNLEKLPIIVLPTDIQDKLSNLLDTQNYEKIDKLIYELYNLTDEEISFIENT